ncbi:MAG: hypothetical protein A2Z04_07385 [Chloroflexi bacterium RBG_16_57_9]|nr:MAG: hypothetical protein A2Z04_07385 [Chloroflexi bacterium RBG_16_57_9]
MGVPKTNSMRVLDAHKTPYEVYTYDPEIHSADGVAAVLGLPASQVYKTLVVLHEKGKPLLVMVAADRELDLKRLARSVGEKRLNMAPHKEAERLTGLRVGGISALALLNRGFEILIDKPALAFEHIYVSAGQRGIDLRLRVEDLIQVTGAKIVEATAND